MKMEEKYQDKEKELVQKSLRLLERKSRTGSKEARRRKKQRRKEGISCSRQKNKDREERYRVIFLTGPPLDLLSVGR